MIIPNIIKLNEWKTRRFLIFALSIQLAFWGLQIFEYTNFYMDFLLVLQIIITFIYITFIPGVTILRILRIYQLDNVETILYSIGLSISVLMFIGFFMNTIYHFIGIYKPISIKYIIITLGLFTSILLIISFIRDKGKHEDEELIERDMTYIPLNLSTLLIILLLSILFSSIFGTYLANFYQNNIVLMFMIILIAMTVVIITTMNKSPIIFPIAIFIISLSLLYHDSLISFYITGWDIQTEYYLSNLVYSNSLWNPSVGSNVNAMLSIVMLAPIFSLLYHTDLIWIYKIIYPILFSLAPVGLFKVFQKQTNDKVAFLSCFYFISMLTYYSEMISLARQQIAELFLVLILVVMMNEKLNNINKSMMYMIFGFSLAVSHYGLSYLFIFSLIIIYLFFSRNVDTIITWKFIVLYIIFALTWYIYMSESSVIISIAKIGFHIKESLLELFNPHTAEGMNTIVRKEVSPMREITKYLNILTQFFIMIGIFITAKYSYIFEKMKLKFQFQKKYMNFAYTNMTILFLGIVVPYMASALNTTRLYQIALIFLAPFSIIGGLSLLTYSINISIENSLTIISIFFSIFVLFNTGFIYVISAEPSASISLNYTADYPVFNVPEVSTAIWVKEKIKANENDSMVYSDAYRDLLLSSMIGNSTSGIGERNYIIGNETDETVITRPPPNSYLFLGKENIKNGKMTLLTRYYKRIDIDLKNSVFYNKILNMSRIYDAGYAQILLNNR